MKQRRKVKVSMIDDVRSAWRKLSVTLSGAFGTAAAVFPTLPEEKQHAILSSVGIPPSLLIAVAFALVIVGRCVKIRLHSEESNQ